ncbi:restriction endonuclease [Campylobacter sp. JMF_02 ED1]|uniref:restriction endonuclease n=1 Tax=unclassified Campylobacter TaxID=2593542 RepID=UPI0022E9B965|nr:MULTISPECIES: restriction endonuclease [unclassified Campylobacter]MDA3049899.1 restriction endonuclease [Campylobacter sp. JMF_15 NE4]MDA3050857.1 restriction endonuclease [Campylobacter sp. JMF_02 ED1]
MAIPHFREMMFPILQFMNDGGEYHKKELEQHIAIHFKLDDSDKNEIYEKTKVFIYKDRVHWALSYMVALGKNKSDEIRKLNLLNRIGRGKYQINKLGAELSKNEAEFIKWCNKVYGKKFMSNLQKSDENSQNTPDENLNLNLDEINEKVKSELLDRILQNEPRFFENLALRLLEKIGYGVSMGELTQNGADGGIDGIVNEDILGFSKIYIQAKRFDKGVVGRPEIQKFVGVLATKPTKKGLFITTSKFSNEAVEFASNLQGYSVVLIDGDRLLDLMLKYKLGVQVKEIKEIFAVDNDFFDDENY